MSTLLLTLAGPQQAWGSRSRFATRATDLQPTRSGVVGLIAAALGMPRSAALDRFDGLRFGVRADQPGSLERDFQTTRSLDGKHSFPLSQRYYLADAVFLVGLEHDEDELEAYRTALRAPQFPLFLGRRAFPPAGPVHAVLRSSPLREALASEAWRARDHHRRRSPRTVSLEVVCDREADEPLGDSVPDVPVSFDPRRRAHDWRDVTRLRIEMDNPDGRETRAGDAPRPSAPPRAGFPASPTDHDAEALLSDEEF